MPDKQFDNEFHRSIVENIADGVYFVDPARTIMYWNRGAEKLTGYSPDRVVGHGCYENILNHVDAEGNVLCHTVCPLAATISDGRDREVAVWLRHADGHRKAVRVRTAQVRDADGRVIGGVETFADDSAAVRAAEDAERARRDSLTDELTGLPNRRLFDTALAGRLENLARYDWPFGLLIADIDSFKTINDEFGHAFGDAALRGVAATLQDATRTGDLLARWGGEEFAVLVEASDGAGLAETAERLRVLVARSEVRLGELTRTVYVSVGGTLATLEDTAESLFTRADAALYAAKKGGRNRVEIAE